MKKTHFLYTACYCEENVWHLCQEEDFAIFDRKVAFISNDARVCPIWGQQAASSPFQPVFWDYHVILLCRQESWMVWDLDTRIGFPLPVTHYLREAFRTPAFEIPQYAPIFRVVDANEYIATFSSDRSHMRKASGEWLAPPPSWPEIGQKNAPNLAQFIDMGSAWIGDVMNFDEFFRNFGA